MMEYIGDALSVGIGARPVWRENRKTILPGGKHWWEYLDVIENALDAAEQADLSLLPALMLRSHRVKAAKKP